MGQIEDSVDIEKKKTSPQGSQGHSSVQRQDSMQPETRAIINRLSRAIGHLEMVRRMIEEGRDCSEVLIQLSAVKSAINNTGKVILKDHIEHCIIDAARTGNMKEIENLNRAISQFVK